MLVLFNFFIFAYTDNVKAEISDVTEVNVCSNSSSVDLGNDSCNGVSSNSIVNNSNTFVFEDSSCTDLKYNIVVLLDKSSSMLNSDKYKKLNTAFSGLITYLKKSKNSNSNNDYNIAVCTYSNDVNCGNFLNISSVNSDTYKLKNTGTGSYSIGGGTFIQGALAQGYRKLQSKKNGYVPMLILITDGAPSIIDNHIKWDNVETGNPEDQLAKHNFPAFTYYTVATLQNVSTELKKLNSNAKILTIGINSGRVSKFVLNPTRANLDSIKNYRPDIYYTMTHKVNYEAYLANWENSATTGITQGSIVSNSSGMKIKFVVPSTYVKQASKSDGLIAFIKDGNSVTKITYKKNETTKTVCDGETDCKKLIFEGRTERSRFKLYSLWDFCNNRNCKNGTFIFKMKNTYKTTEFNPLIFRNDTVDKSIIYNNVNTFVNEFSKVVSDLICDNEDKKVVVDTNEYTNCTESSYDNLAKDDGYNLYYKSGVDYFTIDNQKIPSGSCIKISDISIPYILTENINFNIGQFSPNSVYAGGSFKWLGTPSLTNIVTWRFKYYSNISGTSGKVPTADSISLEAYDANGIATVNKVPLNKIFVNGCNGNNNLSSYAEDINKKILNKVSDNDTVDISSDLPDTFKTIDSNDPAEDINDNLYPLEVIANLTEKKSDNSSNTVTYKYDFSLKYACISNNGQIVSYNDEDDKCDIGFINGGQNRYISLKYRFDSFNISAVGNYSAVSDGNQFNVSISCPMNVRKGLYEGEDGCFPCDDGDELKISYNYRSINVDNPFPKAVSKSDIAENWRDWYCGNDTSCSNTTDNMQRIKNTFSNDIFYRATFEDDKYYDVGYVYTDWEKMNLDGTSEFINNNNSTGITFYPIAKNDSYCGLGKFKEECNK